MATLTNGRIKIDADAIFKHAINHIITKIINTDEQQMFLTPTFMISKIFIEGQMSNYFNDNPDVAKLYDSQCSDKFVNLTKIRNLLLEFPWYFAIQQALDSNDSKQKCELQYCT